MQTSFPFTCLSLSMKFVASNARQVYDIAKISVISREMPKIRPKGLITLCKGRAMSCNATHMDENALVESLVFLAEISRTISNSIEQTVICTITIWLRNLSICCDFLTITFWCDIIRAIDCTYWYASKKLIYFLIISFYISFFYIFYICICV